MILEERWQFLRYSKRFANNWESVFGSPKTNILGDKSKLEPFIPPPKKVPSLTIPTASTEDIPSKNIEEITEVVDNNLDRGFDFGRVERLKKELKRFENDLADFMSEGERLQNQISLVNEELENILKNQS